MVALTVQYEKPAKDLSNFIETGVNENPGYWSPIFNKIYTQEEKENELKLIN